ncbi:MAG: shikimate kinase [Gemmatimonadota bacterium]
MVLVGFMGSGKSTIGPLLSKALGWRFRDLDRVIEAREGRSIPEMFRDDGEAAFRAKEDEIARELLQETELVLAPGGGWSCREGRMESLDEETLSIWLQLSVEGIWRRTARRRGERPLLDVEHPQERIAELLAEREPFYRRAKWWVNVGRHSPKQVVRLIVQQLESNPERPLRA